MDAFYDKPRFAFNIWDFESARAVIDASSLLRKDVIIQTSTNIFKILPAKTFSEFIKSYSAYKEVNVLLNIDHCKERETLFHAVDNGWDMVMVDGSSLSVQENIAFTNEIVSYSHKHNVLVEAEVGQVKGIEDDIDVQQDAIASKEDIQRFITETDVDLIAIAFGNAHGEYKVKPNLHYDLVEYTTSITDKPFVVHGGSGLSDEVLKRLISINGVKKINISTDLKLAYYDGINEMISCMSRDDFRPIDANKIVYQKVKEVAISKMKLLTG